MRSSTSVSKVLFCWLEASLPLASFWELLKRAAGEEEGIWSRRRFLAETGVASMLRRALEASPNTRFFGSVVAGILVMVTNRCLDLGLEEEKSRFAVSQCLKS